MCDHFIQEDVVDVSSRTFEEPYVELFLWAVICNKPGLIQFFWRRCAQPILMAVIGKLYMTFAVRTRLNPKVDLVRVVV